MTELEEKRNRANPRVIFPEIAGRNRRMLRKAYDPPPNRTGIGLTVL
jgi:hypothetical protein